MRVGRDEARYLAHLFDFLQLGEELAGNAARLQAQYIQPTSPKTAKFLRAQSRQESFHRHVFSNAVRLLDKKYVRPTGTERVFQAYYQQVDDALSQGHFAETLFGIQVMLEGVGEVVLENLEQGLVKREAGLQRIRRIILNQEKAHHGFGLRQLEHFMVHENISRDEMKQRSQDFQALGWQLLDDMAPVFVGLDEDQGCYARAVAQELPSWMDHA